MLTLCRNANPLVGLGALCLGAEAIVPWLYGQIVHGFRAAGFQEAELSYFTIHIEDDDAHAETMRLIIRRAIADSPSRLALVQAAAHAALTARTRFFVENTSLDAAVGAVSSPLAAATVTRIATDSTGGYANAIQL
jgi:pyrroloquinoline-quinone synthase